MPIEECEKVVNAMPDKPEIRHGKARACYFPQNDTVDMPNKEVFISIEEYYCVLFHELVHSSGHQKRLNRQR